MLSLTILDDKYLQNIRLGGYIVNNTIKLEMSLDIHELEEMKRKRLSYKVCPYP